jgi:hypothetical protein
MIPDPKDTVDPYMLAAVTTMTALYHILSTMNLIPCTC